MRKLYKEDYFKNLWKVIWKITRQEKGNISGYIGSVNFKHVNKMYIMAKMLYNVKLSCSKYPDFSGINLKFEV